MIVWVLILISSSSHQVFFNVFDSKLKCEERMKIMAPIYEMECIKTKVNK